VFVDSTGSRRRFFALVGVVAGVLLTITTALLVAGFVGGTAGALPGLPGLSRPGADAGLTPGPGPASARTPTPGRTAKAGASATRTTTSASGPAVVASSPAPTGQGHRNTAHPTPSRKK
jgi:hypothetical protein